MPEPAADDMLRDPRHQQRRRVRVPQPVRRERRRHPALELTAQPADLPRDRLRPHRRKPRLAREVDEHPPTVQIADRDIRARVAQPPQVLAVEPVKLIGDVDPPEAAVLDPQPVRVILARNDLDERRVPSPVCQSRCCNASASPSRIPDSASSAHSSRSRTDPFHSRATGSHWAQASRINPTCSGVSVGGVAGRGRDTRTTLRS